MLRRHPFLPLRGGEGRGEGGPILPTPGHFTDNRGEPRTEVGRVERESRLTAR